MLKSVLAGAAGLALIAGAAQAQVIHTGAPTAGIATSVSAPPGYRIVYVSGLNAGGGPDHPIPPDMDTKAQTLVTLEKLKAALAVEHLTFADVTMMNVYLVGVPALDGHMDSKGMNEAFKQYFGTPDQPNKPARVTVQVAALGSPAMFVEISLQAAARP